MSLQLPAEALVPGYQVKSRSVQRTVLPSNVPLGASAGLQNIMAHVPIEKSYVPEGVTVAGGVSLTGVVRNTTRIDLLLRLTSFRCVPLQPVLNYQPVQPIDIQPNAPGGPVIVPPEQIVHPGQFGQAEEREEQTARKHLANF